MTDALYECFEEELAKIPSLDTNERNILLRDVEEYIQRLFNMLSEGKGNRHLCFDERESLTSKYTSLVKRLRYLQRSARTEQDIAPSKRRGRRGWFKRHPHRYGLTVGVIFLILFFVLGLFKSQWRQWCWGVAVLAFLVLIVSLLGGRSRR